MSAIEARNNNDNRGFVLDATAGLSEVAPIANRDIQNAAMKSSRPSTDEARAAVAHAMQTKRRGKIVFQFAA